MLFLRVRRQLLPLLRAASPLPSPIHHRPCLLSTSAAPFCFENYLVAACGHTPAQARKTADKAFKEVSKLSKKPFEKLSRCRLKSAANPDAVLAVLYSVGLARADIASVVAADPLILRSSVKIIKPRLLALRNSVGLSPPQIARLLLVGRRGLRCSNIQFLMSFYGSFEKVLVAAKRNGRLLTSSVESVMEPNIALFRQSGVRDIAKLCSDAPWLLTFKLERVKEFLLRAEELGVPPTSPMFRYAVSAAAFNSKERVAGKLEFLKRILGYSQSEVSIAVSKMPFILGFSDKNLLRKFEFLVNEVGMERKCIVKSPVLFTLSLEKRLIPRHSVVKVLQAKGLVNRNISFLSTAVIGEENFRLKFIHCHKDSVPGLADAYAAACAGGVPLRI